jgi:hypothetical protein
MRSAELNAEAIKKADTVTAGDIAYEGVDIIRVMQ